MGCELKKKLCLALELVKRILLVAVFVGLLLYSTGALDMNFAANELRNNDKLQNSLAAQTGIKDIKVSGIKFRQYDTGSSSTKLYLTYITPSSKSMKVYADAEPDSDEARKLLGIMRNVFTAVNNVNLDDMTTPRGGKYVTTPFNYEGSVTLCAGWHKYTYTKKFDYHGGNKIRTEVLKIGKEEVCKLEVEI